MPNVTFSHMTALYFHGLSIKASNDAYDITVKRSYNSVHLRKHNVFYVDNDIYELGLTEIETPMGNIVKVYDIERLAGKMAYGNANARDMISLRNSLSNLQQIFPLRCLKFSVFTACLHLFQLFLEKWLPREQHGNLQSILF